MSALPNEGTVIAEPAITLDRVTLRAGARTLVDSLSLELAPGERLALVGPNGSGKSTLLRAIAGLDRPHAGAIRRPPGPPGMVFQDGALWPHLTVAGHLAFVDPKGGRAWHGHLLAMLGLSTLAERRPDGLSGGERGRLALARALAARPRWLLLDEPLAHLDAHFGQVLRETLPALASEIAATLIVVVHDAEDVELLSDRVLCLSGEGAWWLGAARVAVESPPTPMLAALSARGTVLGGIADASGCVSLGMDLQLQGQRPGAVVSAFLDAAAVRLAETAALVNEEGGLAGTFVAPDRRGGCWVRIAERLVRCGDARGTLHAGDPVHVHILGAPRVLDPSGAS